MVWQAMDVSKSWIRGEPKGMVMGTSEKRLYREAVSHEFMVLSLTYVLKGNSFRLWSRGKAVQTRIPSLGEKPIAEPLTKKKLHVSSMDKEKWHKDVPIIYHCENHPSRQCNHVDMYDTDNYAFPSSNPMP